jgi:hypothetical protein
VHLFLKKEKKVIYYFSFLFKQQSIIKKRKTKEREARAERIFEFSFAKQRGRENAGKFPFISNQN